MCLIKIWLGDQYKYPVTIELIGIDEIPYGLRILFDVDGCEDGIFLAIDASDWVKDISNEVPN